MRFCVVELLTSLNILRTAVRCNLSRDYLERKKPFPPWLELWLAQQSTAKEMFLPYFRVLREGTYNYKTKLSSFRVFYQWTHKINLNAFCLSSYLWEPEGIFSLNLMVCLKNHSGISLHIYFSSQKPKFLKSLFLDALQWRCHQHNTTFPF